MGWELRRGKLYYYRKARGEDGRVRSIYCGGGERGKAAEREDLARSTTPDETDIRTEKKGDGLAEVNAKKEAQPPPAIPSTPGGERPSIFHTLPREPESRPVSRFRRYKPDRRARPGGAAADLRHEKKDSAAELQQLATKKVTFDDLYAELRAVPLGEIQVFQLPLHALALRMELETPGRDTAQVRERLRAVYGHLGWPVPWKWMR